MAGCRRYIGSDFVDRLLLMVDSTADDEDDAVLFEFRHGSVVVIRGT